MNEQVLNLKINSNIGSVEKDIENLTSKFRGLKNPVDSVTDSVKKLKNELSLSGASKNIQSVSSSLEALKNNSESIVDILTEIKNSKIDGNKLFPDLSNVIANLAGIATIALTVFDTQKMQTFLGIISSSLKDAIGGVASSIGSLLSSLNPAILIIAGIAILIVEIVAALKYVYDTNESVRKSVEEAVTAIQEKFQILSDVMNETFRVIGNTFSELFAPVIEFIETTFSDVWNNILIPILEYFADTIIPNITNVMQNLKDNVVTPFCEFMKAFLIPIIEKCCEVLGSLYENLLKPICNFLGSVFKVAWEIIYEVLNNLIIPVISLVIKAALILWEEVLQPIVDFLYGIFKPAFDEICKGIGGAFDGLTKIFNGILDFIKGIFSNDWKQVWNGIVDIFSGIWDTISSIIKTPFNIAMGVVEGFLNGIIDMWNKMVKKLSNLGKHVPDFLGGPWNFDFALIDKVSIPRLENGGFPSHGSMFIAGENGPEIVGHIGSRTEVLNGSQISGAIYNAVSSAMRENSSSSKQDIRVYAEEGLIVEKVSRGINQHVKQTGSLPFTIPI